MRFALLPLLVLSASLPVASARQSNVQDRRHTTASVRDGGTLHLATGTWTRRATQALATLGPDVLYDNTCFSGYFSALSGDTYVDEGRLPSPSAPVPTGCSTNYRVDGFDIGYCTNQAAPPFGALTYAFYQSYTPCTSVANVTPTASFVLSNLPASPFSGAFSCWNVTIDLTGSGGGSFIMAADGDGVFQGGTVNDRFGWSISSTSSGMTGPLIAGDPNTCPEGAGTSFSPTPGPGTGLGNRDEFYRQSTSGPNGCFFFGGNPFAGFALKLRGTACEVFPVQTNYCAGDGAGTACPCGNNSATGADVGCLNSFGRGGKLRGFGTPSLSNDTFVLLGSDLTNGPCLYFQGTLQENGGNGSLFGDGLHCANGTIIRLGSKQNGNNASQFPSPGDAAISSVGAVTAPGARTYQCWYRNNAAFCTPSGFNLTNGVLATWTP